MKRTAELYAGLAVVAAVVVYFLYKKAKTAIPQATQPISNAIASLITAATLPPPINATHSVILPDGSVVPIANIPGGLTFNAQLNAGQFTYQGQSYLIPGPSDSNGNFTAILPTVPAAAYDPSTLAPTSFSLASTSAPAVLPYSYKQSAIDTPSLLGTDDLLTPPGDYATLDYSLN
jgi:hypothetical protein